jgi:hypothetical protein
MALGSESKSNTSSLIHFRGQRQRDIQADASQKNLDVHLVTLKQRALYETVDALPRSMLLAALAVLQQPLVQLWGCYLQASPIVQDGRQIASAGEEGGLGTES